MRKIMLSIMILVGLGLFACTNNRQSAAATADIYYIGWDILTYVAMSCDDISAEEHCSHIVVTDPEDVNKLVALAYNRDFRTMPDYSGVDTRVCCILKSAQGELLRELSFAHYGLMSIDGVVYETDTALFNAVLGYLPDNYLRIGSQSGREKDKDRFTPLAHEDACLRRNDSRPVP